MSLFVVTFEGSLNMLSEAESRLRRSFPRAKIEHRIGKIYEAELTDADAASLKALADWRINPMGYAEVNPPQVKLEGLAQRLAELRRKHSGS